MVIKILFIMPYESESVSHPVLPDSLWPHGLQPIRFLSPWNSPGKKSGVGSHSLLQEISLTQGSNLGFLLCRRFLINCAIRKGHAQLTGPLKIVMGLPWWARSEDSVLPPQWGAGSIPGGGTKIPHTVPCHQNVEWVMVISEAQSFLEGQVKREAGRIPAALNY